MLGEKIYTLRKNRGISQEEFAEILNTSRQAVSKWERNESKPDIDKLMLIAKLFNVSIDYLLSYEISYSDIGSFINKMKECYLNNKSIIDIDEIRLWCFKYPNNFELHLCATEYLYIAFTNNNKAEYLDLALSCINKAIILFTPECNEIASLNDLHKCVSEIYFMQDKYKLAKEYITKNNVYGCEVLLTKCDLALKKYDSALEIASEIYLRASSDIINVSLIRVRVLLKSNKIQDAYDLVNWSIAFINSIKKDNEFFNNVLSPFIFLKATCEKLLGISSVESIKALKDINEVLISRNNVSNSDSVKYYFGKENPILVIDSNMKNSFKEIIEQTSINDVHYQVLVDIFNEIFGDDINE